MKGRNPFKALAGFGCWTTLAAYVLGFGLVQRLRDHLRRGKVTS